MSQIGNHDWAQAVPPFYKKFSIVWTGERTGIFQANQIQLKMSLDLSSDFDVWFVYNYFLLIVRKKNQYQYIKVKTLQK